MAHVIDQGTSRNLLPLLIAERILHAICMGAATLLPAYLLKRGLNEVYFGTISAISAIFAILIILSLPILLRHIRVERLSQLSGLFLFSGYASLLYAEFTPNALEPLGYIGFPLISAGWVTHFTLGSIKVSGASSDETRQQNFMIYAAFSTLGISLGPVVGNLILATYDSYSILFGSLMVMAVFGGLSSIATMGLNSSPPASNSQSHRDGMLSLIRSPAMFFVVMVFLQSAIFTIIINFQVVFGELNGLHSSAFFICWAAGIMVPRFVLRKWIVRMDNRIVLPFLTGCLALALFTLAIGPTSNILYGITATALGVFYGLSYPIVQAETVKFASPNTRSFFLVAFSMGYFVSYYVTPLAAGVLVSVKGYNSLFAVAGGIAIVMVIAEICFYQTRHKQP
ncbi:MAG: MFS transporter [Pseudoruegeria sp.]